MREDNIRTAIQAKNACIAAKLHFSVMFNSLTKEEKAEYFKRQFELQSQFEMTEQPDTDIMAKRS